VIAVAKKTGDYSVLSHTDICVVALTYELDLLEKEEAGKHEVWVINVSSRYELH
jgi:RNA-binding protein NOB1